MKKQQGFTLIELMIVVAIIGILAAIALPAYQDYTKRAKVSEGLTLASSAKVAVSEYFVSQGELPESVESAGIPSSIKTDNVAGISVGTSGAITVVYTSDIVDNATSTASLILTPTTSSGVISWVCTRGTTMPAQIVPANCR